MQIEGSESLGDRYGWDYRRSEVGEELVMSRKADTFAVALSIGKSLDEIVEDAVLIKMVGTRVISSAFLKSFSARPSTYRVSSRVVA